MAAQYTPQLSNCGCELQASTIKRVMIQVLMGIASRPVPETPALPSMDEPSKLHLTFSPSSRSAACLGQTHQKFRASMGCSTVRAKAAKLSPRVPSMYVCIHDI